MLPRRFKRRDAIFVALVFVLLLALALVERSARPGVAPAAAAEMLAPKPVLTQISTSVRCDSIVPGFPCPQRRFGTGGGVDGFIVAISRDSLGAR